MNPATDLVTPVRKTVTVEAPQEHCFRVFTEAHGTWWPLETHHIGAQPAVTAKIEPRVGGLWFEEARDGTRCRWGRVLEWAPPHRLVLAWEVGADWKHDPNLRTEVEVRFIAEAPRRTRVELEHRNLEAYGESAAKLREAIDSPGGWGGVLEHFRREADATAG